MGYAILAALAEINSVFLHGRQTAPDVRFRQDVSSLQSEQLSQRCDLYHDASRITLHSDLFHIARQ